MPNPSQLLWVLAEQHPVASIFQVGTNNWQQGGEFAPGSGILHEAHHHAWNALDDVDAYSIYPSKTQRVHTDHVRVFELDHDIPICESISPVSSYRWHSMHDAEFAGYLARLRVEVESWIDEIESGSGESMALAVAHHTFVNPLVMQRINQRRESAGKERIPLLCFVHGTALKMFDAEEAGTNPIEFPNRFLPAVRRSGVFGNDERAVDWCAAISNQQIEAFQRLFPDYPEERILLSPNGFNQSVFQPRVEPGEHKQWRNDALSRFFTTPYEGSDEPVRAIGADYDVVVAFCGKFAEWKRLDALLWAALEYESCSQRIATIVVGSGPHDDQVHYQDLARQLGLKDTYFVGPRGQDELATVFNAADVACFPSKNEPFGLVFIEAMGCGTPVIGVNSGGPRDFVTDEVGVLVPEADDTRRLGRLLARSIKESIADGWKRHKGPVAAQYAFDNFSMRTQVENLRAATIGS